MKKYRFLSILLVLIGLGFLYLRFGQPSQVDASVTHVTPTPTPYHRTCRDRSCVRVAGHGESSCEESEDCHASPSATPTPVICSEDYTHEQGNCVTPTPPVPTPTVDPCGDGQCITPTPEPTLPPVEHHDNGPAGVPALPTCQTIMNAPTITKWVRTSIDSVALWWTKTDNNPDQSYLIWYGTSPTSLPWNVIVKGSEYTEIHNLPPVSIWTKVASINNGCIGPYSVTVDPPPSK